MQEIASARRLIESLLLKLVKKYGTSYEEEAAYFSNEFGIEPLEDESIDKVYDFFGGQGVLIRIVLTILSLIDRD